MATDKPRTSGNQIEGEGSYSGAKQYNDATKKFVDQGKVEQAAKSAKPKSDAEAREMRDAEREGKSHAKGEDPALNRGGTAEDSGASRK